MGVSPKFVPKGQIDNKFAIVPVMAQYWTDKKSLPEPMLKNIYDAIGSHQATMSSIIVAWRWPQALVNWVTIGSGNSLLLV